jgi:hypothetical protein
MIEQLVDWLNQHPTTLILIAVISTIVFVLSLKRTITNISATNRSVSAGRDINAPIMTGDVNSGSASMLGKLANVATIIALIISAISLYFSYLALIE